MEAKLDNKVEVELKYKPKKNHDTIRSIRKKKKIIKKKKKTKKKKKRKSKI